MVYRIDNEKYCKGLKQLTEITGISHATVSRVSNPKKPGDVFKIKSYTIEKDVNRFILTKKDQKKEFKKFHELSKFFGICRVHLSKYMADKYHFNIKGWVVIDILGYKPNEPITTISTPKKVKRKTKPPKKLKIITGWKGCGFSGYDFNFLGR